MLKFEKIVKLSGQIASALLKDKSESKELEESDLVNAADKEYIIKNLTNEILVKERLDLESQINKEQDWQALVSKIKLPKKRSYWKYSVAAAAVLIAFVSLGIWFDDDSSLTNTSTVVEVENPIVPGVYKATLTLDDGTQVILEEGTLFNSNNIHSNGSEIAYDDIPVNSSKSSEVKYNVISIPRKGQFSLKLSDGTQVWLNSETEIKYPVQFIAGQTRKVELVYGEAYFDVSPSTAHEGTGFKVLSGDQEVSVLGTEFNIKAYHEDAYILTTLVEGSVALGVKNKVVTKQILKPSQQSIFNKLNSNITINQVDPKYEVSWKDGNFTFYKKPLKEIMLVMERWYDVKIEFENKKIEDIQFTGRINKTQNLEEILYQIKTTTYLNAYEIKEKEIILK